MKIWQRHILFELVKTFFFFLGCIFTVYVTVDLSVHGVRFLSSGTLKEMSIYYLFTFSTLLELFLTLSFLLSLIRVLYDLNCHREILALQMAGLSKKRIVSCLFYFAGFLTLLCYANNQWLAPIAQDTTYAFRKLHKNKKKKEEKLFSLSLDDGTKLVYQSFDAKSQELFDVFWICTPNDLWHMKHLKIPSMQGRFVDHLARNSEKQLQKLESFKSKTFSNLLWDEEAILHRFVPYESRSLFTLLFQKGPAERSHFYYKLFAALMPFIVLFALTPLLLQYSRVTPIFLIASFSLFALIGLKVILDGMLILGENQALPAFVALFSPIFAVLCLTMPLFIKVK